MNRGTHRRVIAACVLAACLVLAVPQTAEAGLTGPGFETIQGFEEPRQELTFLERMWQAFQSFWARSSVLIVPD